MAALTSDRNTPVALGDLRTGTVAADEKIFAGALIMRNAAGFLVAGATALNLIGVGRAEDVIDNTGGANGDVTLTYRVGLFRYVNSGSDPVTTAEIGSACYAVDDQTVAASDGSGTRSKAGVVEMIDTSGVWVAFCEALTRAAS